MATRVRLFIFFDDAQGIARPDRATMHHPGEDALFRHGALSDLVVYGAAGVAFLAYLGYLQHGAVAGADVGADRYVYQVHAFDGKVLGEVAWPHIQAQLAHFFDAVRREKAHLPMADAIGMGVAAQAEVDVDFTLAAPCLASALLLAGANGYYYAFHFIPQPSTISPPTGSTRTPCPPTHWMPFSMSSRLPSSSSSTHPRSGPTSARRMLVTTLKRSPRL